MTTYPPNQLVQIDATYENVAAICPKCSIRNIYNRASEIGHFGLLSNHRVQCHGNGCGAEFSIGGDLINPAYEMLLLDSSDLLREKRCMQAVLSAATAYERFFSHYMQVELIFRPERRDRSDTRERIEWLNATSAHLQDRLAQHTFEPMRRIFLRFAVDAQRIATMAAADAYISQIPARPAKVLRADILALADERRRSLLLRVHNATIGNLRNKIVHKTAYRPSLDEARVAVENASSAVFSLGALFRLGDINYHLNESLEDCA